RSGGAVAALPLGPHRVQRRIGAADPGAGDGVRCRAAAVHRAGRGFDPDDVRGGIGQHVGERRADPAGGASGARVGVAAGDLGRAHAARRRRVPPPRLAVVAWPVGYKTARAPSAWFDATLPERLGRIDWGVHEWVGLIMYRLLDRTDA